MECQPASLSLGARYKLVTGLVVPRPIAVVSTVSIEGMTNVAPFSYFTIASHDPLMLAFTITGRKPDGSPKDTLRHVRPAAEGGTGEFVVNVAIETYGAQMVRSSAPLPAGRSEFEAARLTPQPSRAVRPPRVGEAPAWFECRTWQVLPVGPQASLVLGEVVHLGVRDDLVTAAGQIDFGRLGAVGRLAGTTYCRLSDRFDLPDEGFFPARAGTAPIDPREAA